MSPRVNVEKLLEWRNSIGHFRLVTRDQTLAVQLMVGGIWHSQEDTCVPQSGATRPEAIRELKRELARLVETAGRTPAETETSKRRNMLWICASAQGAVLRCGHSITDLVLSPDRRSADCYECAKVIAVVPVYGGPSRPAKEPA